MKASEFFSELRRRNVYKVAVAYAAVGWVIMQVTATVVPALHLPDALTTIVVVLVLLGLPIALVIAWAFEMTPEGMKRTEDISPNENLPQWSRRKFIAFVVSAMLVAGGLLIFQQVRFPGGGAAATASRKSIAVLPFENLSRDPDNAYFAEGIHDEILTRLAKIADLKVISRTSTEQYQSKPGNVAEIAQQLGVTHILEGSVQKAGDAVRVNVQLIKAREDSHLWADTYDRKLTDIFAVETEVAERIARSLAAQLTGGERKQIARIPTANPQAYDAYLRGLALIRRQAMADVKKGRAFMQQAVALDPLYAQAWAQISIAEAQIYFGDDHTEDCLARARHAAETAVRLQPQLGEARAALGLFYYLCLHDYDRALAELNEARSLSPNDGNAIFLHRAGETPAGQTRRSDRFPGAGGNARSAQSGHLGKSRAELSGEPGFRGGADGIRSGFRHLPGRNGIHREKAETYMAQGDLGSAEKLFSGWDLEGTHRCLGRSH